MILKHEFFRILFCEGWMGHRTFLLPPSFHQTILQTDLNYGCRIINSLLKKLMWSLGSASRRPSFSSVFSTGATSSPGTQDRRNNGNKWKPFLNWINKYWCSSDILCFHILLNQKIWTMLMICLNCWKIKSKIKH